ncbi:MAG: glycosyltransferase [Nitrospiraceae bacterium]|nr:MAG: glycosyltransferase [Nitrospiraceae bacterium]
MNKPVSIIICTYNRAHLLERLLLSLSHQTLSSERFEVVVVDDGSKDTTRAVCDELRGRLRNITYVSVGKNIGLADAANMGIRSAEGDYLLFTDDDCIPRRDWAERMCAALDREPVVAGAIESPDREFVKLCHNISEFHPFLSGQKARFVRFIAGANMGFRRPVLEELKGFQAGRNCSPDMELILRARQQGYSIYFTPDAAVLHDPPRTTLKSIFKYSADHAAFTIILRNKYRSVLQTPFVLRSPGFLLVASPIIALRVAGGIYFQNYRLFRYVWTAPVIYALKLAWCWGAARGLRNWNKSVRKA